MGERLVVGHLEDHRARHGAPGAPAGVAQRPSDRDAARGDRGAPLRRLIGGARRDEEKARAKERIFSHRDGFGQWQPKEQRPELWTLFNTRHRPGEHFRAFPISNWTELDVWLYIAREHIPLPGLYYAHQRPVIRRKGLLVPQTDVTPPQDGERVETATVRFRTVGDMTCTCPVESSATSAAEIVAETLTVTVSERGATRMDDRTSDASMERRKKEGYF
jgi:sulfate adenylyltransferase subunit 2